MPAQESPPAPAPSPAEGLEAHPKPGVLSDFILGSQDGIVNILGIILGLAAARVDVRIILVAALAALGAEAVAMTAVAYTTTLSRRRLYLSEIRRERHEMAVVPDMERAEVRAVLVEWGYAGSDLDDLLERICRNPRAMLEFMMAFELKLAPVEETAPRSSALLVGSATIVGSLIPLLPFILGGGNVLYDALASIALTGGTLFTIGLYEARVTAGVWWSNGLQMLLIGLGGGFAGYLIGHFVSLAPGL
jgi:VIT1/CCC1 family predicted Fe2+/Mn2+ transporter